MQYCYHNWETDIETALLSNLQTFQILPVFLLFQMFSSCCQFAHYKKILVLKPKEKKCYFLAQGPLRITLSRWLFLSCWSPESGIFPPSFFGFHDLDIFEDRPFILSDGSICVHLVFPHRSLLSFGRNVMVVLLRCPCCPLSGGACSRFSLSHCEWHHFDHLVQVVVVPFSTLKLLLSFSHLSGKGNRQLSW